MEFNKTTLKNGVRVLTEKHPDSHAAVVGAWVDLGSRDEPQGLWGACHFIEHLVFKGTKKRSVYDIAYSMESVGGELNAFTSREQTCFHAVCLKKDLRLAVDVLCDLITQATFPAEEMGRERDVVLQEMKMEVDQPEEYVFDLFFERVMPTHSLGRAILGTKSSVENMKRDDLLQFYKDHYCSQNLIFSAAGNVDHQEVVDLVAERMEAQYKEAPERRRRRPKVAPVRSVVRRSTEQTHILVGFETERYGGEQRFESYLVSHYLGGGMTSRIYQLIREKKGLAYSVYSYLSTYVDSGLSMVYAGTDALRMPEVVELIWKELERLRQRGVSAKELEFYQNQIKGSILLNSDDLENRMNSLAINEMAFGHYRPVEQVIGEIESLTVDHIRAYLDKYLLPEKQSVVVLGDIPEKETEQWLQSL